MLYKYDSHKIKQINKLFQFAFSCSKTKFVKLTLS